MSTAEALDCECQVVYWCSLVVNCEITIKDEVRTSAAIIGLVLGSPKFRLKVVLCCCATRNRLRERATKYVSPVGDLAELGNLLDEKLVLG